MALSELAEALKGKKPVEYVRVSSGKQETKGAGLKSQAAEIKRWLKRNKITRQPRTYSEVISGGVMKKP